MYQSKSMGRNRVSSALLDGTKKNSISLVELKWIDTFNSGNTIIDAQHQALFYLGNELLDAILSEMTKSNM